ncbi:MAG: hypothetical protein KDD47_12960, partial [Acidobacteria bacterium]|nr:hypothetical protein [Acidobacteriota bacterium]
MSDDRNQGERWRRLVRGELSRDERLQLVRDALAAVSSSAPPEAPSAALASEEDQVFSGYERVWSGAARALARDGLETEPDRRQAEGALAELLTYPHSHRRLALCEEPRFQSWSLCELLLERSWEEGFDHPAEALELAELAVGLAAELHTQHLVPQPLIFDLKARAWAFLGNARRITSDLRGAEKAFELAESLIRRGTGDPVEEGRILELQASLAMATRRLDEAGRLLTRASGLYQRAGSVHLRGRCRVSQGLLWGQREEPAKAVEYLRRGLEEIDSTREPRLQLVAIHNLCLYLSELGRRQEALDLLARARQLHAELANSLDLVRLRWLEGRMALASGRIEEAEQAFVEVREEFIRREIGYDVAL